MPSSSRPIQHGDLLSEERLVPVIRARLAKKLAERGLRVKEIAQALRVTRPAVTQYIAGRRGGGRDLAGIDQLLDPLAESLARRFPSGIYVETVELLEIARQVSILREGERTVEKAPFRQEDAKPLDLLRARLKLELNAAERYLELANGTSDDYTKLLLRMIAADSIRHGDVVSQLISWIEAGGRSDASIPDEALLKSMLSVEESAEGSSLLGKVEVNHPVAPLLLRWIDMDERKHDRIVRKLMALNAGKRRGSEGRSNSGPSKQALPRPEP